MVRGALFRPAILSSRSALIAKEELMRPVAVILAAFLALASTASTQTILRPSPQAEKATMHYRNGWQLMRHEAWAEAISEFRSAIETDPQYTLAYYGLGRAYMPLGRYVEAISAYKSCRELYKVKAGEKFSNQLQAKQMREDEMLGLREIARANSGLPQNAGTQNFQRQLQTRIRQIQNSTDRDSNVAIDASVPAFVSVALGSAYFRAERWPEAEEAYTIALQADSNAGEAHNNLAVLYMLTNRFDQSEKEVRLAEKAGFPVNPGFKRELAERRQP
jgi:tetratricopeptide (TPR) repeat protein